MRSSRRIAPVILALGLAACEDAKDQAVAPSAPAPASSEQSLLMPDAGPNAALALERQITSVCKAYRKASAQLKHDLAKTPDDAELLAQSKALKDMTDDACN
jgi:hypothetical protein